MSRRAEPFRNLPAAARLTSYAQTNNPMSCGYVEPSGKKRNERQMFRRPVYGFREPDLLVADHMSRPLYVTSDKHIFLESFHPNYEEVNEFVIAIAEPHSRPQLIHEFQMTPHSIHSACSVGFDSKTIIERLTEYSKNVISEKTIMFIKSIADEYGQLKLSLREGQYFLETQYKNLLLELLSEDGFKPFVENSMGFSDPKKLVKVERSNKPPYTTKFFVKMKSDSLTAAREFCMKKSHSLTEEYEFTSDTRIPDLGVNLNPTTRLRPYQEKALSKMISTKSARSGIIVLPCGAGKTLVGIAAACTIGKSTLVVCTNFVAVEQWIDEFRVWTNIKEDQIGRWDSSKKIKFENGAGILVTTYKMLSFDRTRSTESQDMERFVKSIDWGLEILDEVHVAPAKKFRLTIEEVNAHVKLGLTATLVREDQKIGDLNFLIGPKIYEANWMDLQKAGYIARVQCAEVWCTMPPKFFEKYLSPGMSEPRKVILSSCHPEKFQTTRFLIDFHTQRGDKILVFSDNIVVLRRYATRMKKPYIYGKTPYEERMKILELFKADERYNCLFISKVGDNSIDIPGASVIIQITGNYGSRRQEAQRLGRILRKKEGYEANEFSAFFYTLVTPDTNEVYYSSKRQNFLVTQGYSYKVITNILDYAKGSIRDYVTEEEQDRLLEELMNEKEEKDKKITVRSSKSRTSRKKSAITSRGTSRGDRTLRRVHRSQLDGRSLSFY